MGNEISTRTLAPCTMASLRQTLQSAADEGLLWERLWSALPAAGASLADSPRLVTVYHDDFLLTRNADLEVLLEVAAPFDDTDLLRCRQVPGTLVASSRQGGAVPDMHRVFDALGRWIARNGYRFAGPMFSIYQGETSAIPQAGRQIAEVCAPVSVLQL